MKNTEKKVCSGHSRAYLAVVNYLSKMLIELELQK
jgi:hypothetical protein